MSRERAIRRMAADLGYSIRRYRGGFQVLTTETWIVAAERLATLEDVERFLIDAKERVTKGGAR